MKEKNIKKILHKDSLMVGFFATIVRGHRLIKNATIVRGRKNKVLSVVWLRKIKKVHVTISQKVENVLAKRSGVCLYLTFKSWNRQRFQVLVLTRGGGHSINAAGTWCEKWELKFGQLIFRTLLETAFYWY